MKTRIVLSFLGLVAFSFALAGEANAKGACVYVKNETFQCTDRAPTAMSCKQKAPAGLGEFHAGTSCKNIGFGTSWGIASPPPPPAKPSFEGVSFSLKAPAEVPSIPSPFQKVPGKHRRF